VSGLHERHPGWVKRAAASIWMNILILLVVTVAALTSWLLPMHARPPADGWGGRALVLFAVWLLSFVPGWLYIRFLGLRAGALWNEYVLNLYRLRWDDPRYLPKPPRDSQYYRAAADGHELGSLNIYRQKFDAYYGRQVSEHSSTNGHTSRLRHAGDGHTGVKRNRRAGSVVTWRKADDFTVNVETLFPVFLCTCMLAVGWAALLWQPVGLVRPSGVWAPLEFAFLGAYAFSVSMLVRRFYQSDLRPSAYATVVLRVVLVLVIVAVLHQCFAIVNGNVELVSHGELITAFVIGFFPLVGLQALQRVAAKTLRVFVPQLAPEYPLDQLDGLNIWYEARLVEEGVEDMQNLTTMNLVDVILHTRAPVGRLVDWVDQAFLLIHLEPVERSKLNKARKQQLKLCEDSRDGLATRIALRRLGVRSATDLLKVFGTEGQPISEHGQPLVRRAADIKRCGLNADQIAFLVRILENERGLDPVWNWKAGGPQRYAESPRTQAPRQTSVRAGSQPARRYIAHPPRDTR
jgi:hypothetical protein